MVLSNQDSQIPQTPKISFWRRNHLERVVFTPNMIPPMPNQDSALASSPYHHHYPSLNSRAIPCSLPLCRKPVPVRTTWEESEFPISSSHNSPVSMQTSIPISTPWQLSPFSISTPEPTSPVSAAPTSPVSTFASIPIKTGLLYSTFVDPCGFPGLNKAMYGRDGTPAPQLPPLETDSTPLKAKKGSEIPTLKEKTAKIEKVAQSARPALKSADTTPSKAEKVLGPHEVLQVKKVEVVKAKKAACKSRIPSLFRSFGLSGVKDNEYHDALPNCPLLTTTPSPTRSKFPKLLAPHGFVHVSQHGDGHDNGQDSQPDIALDRSLRMTPDSEPPSPPHTPHTLSSISESDETPLSSMLGVTSTRTYNTPADLRAADFDFFNKDSGQTGDFKSRSKIPRSPGVESSTTPIRRHQMVSEESVSESNFSKPSRLPLPQKLYCKQAMGDVQAITTTPQHRSTLPTTGTSNTSKQNIF